MATAKNNKKTSANKPAAKAKTGAAPISAVKSNVATADQLVHASTNTVKDMIAAGTEEAQKAQEKAFSFGKENAEKWSQSANEAVRSFSESFASGKEQVDALVESSKVATDLSKELQEAFINETNALFSENIAYAKELLSCRTLDDVVDVQNRAMQNSMDHFFNQSARLSEAWFKLSTEAAQPLNDSFVAVTKKAGKAA